jgi:hypothetical protein
MNPATKAPRTESTVRVLDFDAKPIDVVPVRRLGNLIVYKDEARSCYPISHVLTGREVSRPRLRSTAYRYLAFLTAGGLEWAFTEAPKRKDFYTVPEVRRGVILRNLTRGGNVPSEDELRVALETENTAKLY